MKSLGDIVPSKDKFSFFSITGSSATSSILSVTFGAVKTSNDREAEENPLVNASFISKIESFANS